MTSFSDLSCYHNGKQIYGTAAVLHRLCTKEPIQTREEHEAELAECRALIEKLGYAHFDD